MSDIGGVDAVPGEKFRLEREDAKQLVDRAAYQRQPAFAPRPYLRRHQIENRNAQLLEPARNTQMEIGTIGQDRDLGLLGARGLQQFPVEPRRTDLQRVTVPRYDVLDFRYSL